MASCLIALGSNLGDRSATLDAVLNDLSSLPQTRLAAHSQRYEFHPIGGPAGQPDYLNAAALLETNLAPPTLFEYLLQIEKKLGRRRDGRWSARTLDIDMLLYDDLVIDAPNFVLPHPRMSFRRFVLQPALDIAPQMVHPIIGATIYQLAVQLERGQDVAPILSPSHADRRELCDLAAAHFGAKVISSPTWHGPQKDDPWPERFTTWLAFPPAANQAVSTPLLDPDLFRTLPIPNLPRLTILVEAQADPQSVEATAAWESLRQRRERGPTLAISAADRDAAACELSAAIESVWPHLGRNADPRVQ